MKNLFSYCGLVDVRINASDKDLPVQTKECDIKYEEFNRKLTAFF
jgi:hypothetical protein